MLGETLRRYQPNWHLTLCLSDEEPPGFSFDAATEPFDAVVRIQDLGIPDLRRWIFEHDVVELCTAVKGQMLCRLLDEGAQKVVYLDPDIAVFNSLEDVAALLDDYNVVLTPHQLEPDETTSAIIDNEIGSLKAGIYNLGFIAVSGTEEGKRFARWWRDRLLQFCFDEIGMGLFTDQRWCDHVPAFFEGVHILRDPGYNVASWNLSRRNISITEDGQLLVNKRPLRFFHFTKVTWVGEAMLERYAGDRIEVFELLYWYRRRLAANAVRGLPERWWAYDKYNSGVSIPRSHRRAFRDSRELRRRAPDPFAADPAMFEHT